MTSWQTKEVGGVGLFVQRTYIRRLCGYIKDNSTIAAHAKREFGAVWAMDEIEEIRRKIPKPYVKPLEPLITTESTRWAQDASLGSRRLRDKVLRAARG